MKRMITRMMCMLALCTGLTLTSAQTPRQVLDATASVFSGKKGVKAQFKADSFVKGELKGSVSGTMCIQGNKFQMTTPSMITWFNGTTQWSYSKDNEEVNISTPTDEELQNINPSTFVQLYKSGYDYKMKETSLRGKTCYEITLSAQKKNKDKNLRTIILNIDKSNYDLMCVRMFPKNGKDCTRISVHQLQKGMNFSTSDFEFTPKDYPKAEIIDLR